MSDNMTPSVNPYSAPNADLTEQRTSDETQLAGRWLRLIAAILDALIMSLFTVVPAILYFGGWAGYAEKAVSSPMLFKLLGVVIGIPVYLLINGRLLAKDGQSIGKKVMGIKIVRSDGSHADFTRILVRRLAPVYVAQIIPFVGALLVTIDALFIFRDSKQCLHDQIADTIVVRA